MPLRVLLAAHHDVRDQRQFAGISYHMLRALERHPGIHVDVVSPLREVRVVPQKVRQQIYRSVFRRDHHRIMEPGVLAGFGRQVERAIDELKPSVVLAPSSITVSNVRSSVPVAFWSDATFAAMLEFYPEFRKLSARTVRNGHAMERSALKNAALAVYSSDWAATSAIQDYGADPSRVAVIPFGASIESEPRAEELENALASRRSGPVKLLFVGKDWKRKGGDRARQVARLLREKGIEAELRVVGAPAPEEDACTRNVGFIDKRTPSGADAFKQEMLTASFFVLFPSADCAPVVIAEASAHGLPSVVTDVGGMATLVEDDVTGKLFAETASAEEIASWLDSCVSDQSRHDALARAARRHYENRLNWDSAINAFIDRIRSLV